MSVDAESQRDRVQAPPQIQTALPYASSHSEIVLVSIVLPSPVPTATRRGSSKSRTGGRSFSMK